MILELKYNFQERLIFDIHWISILTNSKDDLSISRFLNKLNIQSNRLLYHKRVYKSKFILSLPQEFLDACRFLLISRSKTRSRSFVVTFLLSIWYLYKTASNELSYPSNSFGKTFSSVRMGSRRHHAYSDLKLVFI